MSVFHRLRQWSTTHKAWSAVLLLSGASVLGLALFWFAPWKLFVDEHVAEASPPTAARVLSSGAFRGLEHETSGTAHVMESDGQLLLRLADLRTSNGPDLVVLLSETPATDDSWTAYGKGRVLELGSLKGNIGSQNYTLPAGVDLSRYRSAVIWCRRFSVAFGAAPLVLGDAAVTAR